MNGYGHRNPGYFILFTLIVLAVIVIGAFALFHYLVPPPAQGYYFGYWPFFPLGMLGFFIVLFLIFGVLRWAFWGWGWRHGGYGGSYADPKQILKRRYARGDITKEQFEQMMRDLDQHS